VALDEVREEAEVDELEAKGGPAETHGALEDTGAVVADGVGGTAVVGGVTEDGGGDDRGCMSA
jgi:hypothetical protein